MGQLRPFVRPFPSARPLLTAGVVLAALAAGPVAPTQAQAQAQTGSDPMPLVPPPATGTLDPSLGELDQPEAPPSPQPSPQPDPYMAPMGDDDGQPRNPDLGPPRVIGGTPGLSQGGSLGGPQGDALPPPGLPTAPTGFDGQGAAPLPAGVTATGGSTDPADASVLARAQGAVADATVTVRELRADSGFKAELNDFLSRARAAVVVPSFFKGGFVVGAAYGTALLLVRDETGTFSQPAFLEMSAGSVGFQAGAQDARIVLLVMTDAGLQAILKDRFKMEAGASLSFGIFGGGLATGSTTDVNQDIVAFSHSRGLFAGGALEGAVIEPRPDWNAVYYDAPGVTPEAIVFERRVANPASAPLIQALQAPAPVFR